MKAKRMSVARCAAFLCVVFAAAACGFTMAGQTAGNAPANPRVEQQDGFTMVGISVRTSNAKERVDSQIGKQWGRLMGDNLLAAIPNKADHNIVAVYTKYASDKNGEYTYVLGARVNKADEVPAGMVVQQVLPGRYAVFTSERGPVQQVVVATWKHIWEIPKDAPGGDRAYKTDFELYDQRAQNPADAVMEVHIGIR
jgi:predicted transcriptional regulator YdeE